MAIVRTGYANYASFPVTGAANIIYVDLSNGNEYTWITSSYVAYTGTRAGVRVAYKDAAWFSDNTTALLGKGQIVYLEQTGTYKLGDGVTQLSALSFLGGSSYTLTTSEIGSVINSATSATPNDNDLVISVDTSVAKKNTWTQIKAFLKIYFDTVYTTTSAVSSQITSALTGYVQKGTLTNNYIQKATASDKIGNSSLYFDGSDFVLDAPVKVPLLTANTSIEVDVNNMIVSVSKPFVTPEMYGAIGDGTTDDYLAITNAVNSGFPVYFHNKTYKVNSQITVDNSAAMVIIYGNNAKLLSGISSVGSSIFRIYQANKVFITNLNFNFNASATAHYGLRLGDNAGSKYVGVARVTNCDFYNFGVENQRGMFVENTPFVSGLSANFNLPSLLIDGCNFYNQNTTNTINYTTATYYGIGIQLGELTDYCKITNCNFNFIRTAVWSAAGANLDITGCNFLGCLPKQVSAYTYGVIYVPNTGTNNGKINVVGCKFNHNYGYCFYYAYATAERPVTISDCHFIANATTIFYATHTSAVATRHRIVNNYFERSSQAYTNSWTGQPFGASLQPFIYLNNQTRCLVRMNTFLNDGSYGVTSANSADYNIVKNNSWFNITGITSLVGANNQTGDNDNL